MIEFYTTKRIDNSRLVRQAAPRRLREMAQKMAWGAVLASCCLLYTWQHFEEIQLRYQLEDMQARHTQAVELNQQLHLEAASLSSPMRIDTIARHQLGMTVFAPAEYAPAADTTRDAYLAQPVAVQPLQP